MRVRLLIVGTFLIGTLSGVTALDFVSEVMMPFGVVIRNAKWPLTEIPVCWENMEKRFEGKGDLVRRAVHDTWEAAAGGGIRFSEHWGNCVADSTGIRIRIADEGSQTKYIGKLLDREPAGMVLNFSFKNWSIGCRANLDFCIRAIAAHEFGHALGFTHEQNRDDAPEQCRREHFSGSVGDYKITDYDTKSIMNYCNKKWNGDGKLSPLDIVALRTFYPLDSLQTK